MRKIKIITMVLGTFFSVQAMAQNNEIGNIEKAIMVFAKAGDASDAKQLDQCLDDNYRVVMNQMFGSKEVSVMNKEVYLEKIRTKVFGGDQRKVNIEQVLVNGNTACAKVRFEGTKMTFVSILHLVQDEKGAWKLVSDTPILG